ncbi:MAG: hypothetical protein QXG12_07660 [Thermoproteota archaeon]
MISGQTVYPITITNVETLDILGNPQGTFVRGSNVLVESTIYYQQYGYYYYYYYYFDAPLQYMLLVQITDPDGYVVFIGFVKDIIQPGGTKTAGSGYLIPSEALTGGYTVEVFVWNKWPSQPGWEALSEPGEATFEVTS